jgi:hypothetical protein
MNPGSLGRRLVGRCGEETNIFLPAGNRTPAVQPYPFAISTELSGRLFEELWKSRK